MSSGKTYSLSGLRTEPWTNGAFVIAVVSVTVDGTAQAYQLPLAGRHTFDSFSVLQSGQGDYRRWALESAALDLALRQAGHSLAENSWHGRVHLHSNEGKIWIALRLRFFLIGGNCGNHAGDIKGVVDAGYLRKQSVARLSLCQFFVSFL